MELEFDKIYKIVTVCLNLSWSHPYIKKDKKWLLKFTIVHGIFTLAFLLLYYNVFYHDLKINNFIQTCKNSSLGVLYIVVTFQYCVLLWHQDSFVDMIKNIKSDYERSKNFDFENRNVVYKYVKKSRWVCKQWFILMAVGCGSFFLKNFGVMLYHYFNNDFKLVPFYDLVYPTIIERNKDNIYVFLLTYILMLIYNIYSGIVYVAYVPLGPIFMLHACGQLELVEKQIDNLFVDYDEQAIRNKLKHIVEHLQYIYSFVDQITKIFNIAYELTLKAHVFMLPIICYGVLKAFNKGEVSMEFSMFITGSILITGLPCYYSDLLMEKGEKVRLSLYMCGWETIYDRRTRTTLLIMLHYALKPVTIRTVFGSLYLDTLTNVFQQSYALFNLINAMWD